MLKQHIQMIRRVLLSALLLLVLSSLLSYDYNDKDEPVSKTPNILLVVADDLAEQHDLKEIESNKYHELLNEWDKFAREIKVQVPTPLSN
jgi:hypothetical protein